jgi:hypothetical protein
MSKSPRWTHARSAQRASHRRARQHRQLTDVPLPLPGEQVDDQTDMLFADLVEALEGVIGSATSGGTTNPSPFTQPSGHR